MLPVLPLGGGGTVVPFQFVPVFEVGFIFVKFLIALVYFSFFYILIYLKSD